MDPKSKKSLGNPNSGSANGGLGPKGANWAKYREETTLIFFSLPFLRTARKTTKRARISYACRTLKILGKEGRNAQNRKEFLEKQKDKEIQKRQRRRGRFCKRVDLANVPSFRFLIESFPLLVWSVVLSFVPLFRFWGSKGTSAKTTLLETNLLRTPDNEGTHSDPIREKARFSSTDFPRFSLKILGLKPPVVVIPRSDF